MVERTACFVYNRKAVINIQLKNQNTAAGESEGLAAFFWGEMITMTIQNVLVVLISYFIGSLLPAELVAWVVKRRPCSEIGSGNPGFANITSSIGIIPGLIVLAGDIAKTYIGMRIAYDFTRGDTVLLTSLLSLCALVTGHNFPLWNLFRGGKGVAVTCTGIILITPTLGIPAVLIGFVMVLLTGWLPLGALLIPSSYLLMCAFLLPEAVPYAIFLTAMMLIRHLPGLVSIFTGKCPRTSPFEIFKKTNRMVDEPEPEYIPVEETAPADEEAAAVPIPEPVPVSEEDELADGRLSENEDVSADGEAETSGDGNAEAADSSPASWPTTDAAEETGDPDTAPEADADDSIAIWTIPEAADIESPDSPEPADSDPAEAPRVPEEGSSEASDPDSSEKEEDSEKDESSSQAALWKTGLLPSMEEIRRHRLKTMKEVPEAKAASSPFQGRRHAHRSSSARENLPEDGVIFYSKSENDNNENP